MNTARIPIPMPARPADLNLASPQEARFWFAAEFSALCAAMRMASESESHGHVWRLAWAISDFTVRQSRWKELETINQAALTAATAIDDPHGRGSAYRFLSIASHYQGRPEDTKRYNELGIGVYLQAGLIAEQALSYLESGTHLQNA